MSSSLNFLDNAVIQEIAKATASLVLKELEARDKGLRWVKPGKYCEYHRICKSTLLRNKHKFAFHNAVKGAGKAIRYDINFSLK